MNALRLWGLLALFALAGCDNQGSYTFIVESKLEVKEVEIRFSITEKSVIIQPGEKKTMIIIQAPLNSPAHNCLEEHGLKYFSELSFVLLYVDGERVEKQLGESRHWKHRKKSKWQAEYTMTVTEETLL